jgi:hypothetical protein
MVAREDKPVSLGLNKKEEWRDEPDNVVRVRVEFGSIFWPLVAAWAACVVLTAILYAVILLLR